MLLVDIIFWGLELIGLSAHHWIFPIHFLYRVAKFLLSPHCNLGQGRCGVRMVMGNVYRYNVNLGHNR